MVPNFHARAQLIQVGFTPRCAVTIAQPRPLAAIPTSRRIPYRRIPCRHIPCRRIVPPAVRPQQRALAAAAQVHGLNLERARRERVPRPTSVLAALRCPVIVRVTQPLAGADAPVRQRGRLAQAAAQVMLLLM